MEEKACEFLAYTEKTVIPKGLQKEALPKPEKLSSFLFQDELEKRSLLTTLSPLPLPSPHPLLFYPGCGTDIFFPLFYCDSLFPSLSQISMLLLDVQDCSRMIKTILDEIGISFAELEPNKIQFYWNTKLITLECRPGDVFEEINNLPPFEVYFERAFRIMKDPYPDYESKVVQKLKPGGILISDSGFQQFPWQKIGVPQELSAYKEMIVGVKR